MPIEDLTANHIGQRDGQFEPQRQNNALLYITGLTENQNDVITLALQSFPIPKTSSGIVEVDYLNEKRKFAGKPIYDDLSVVVKDYCDRPVAQALWAWRKRVHNWTDGKVGLARNYKLPGLIRMVAPDGTFDREYDIEGMWPSAMDPGDIDMSAEDAVQITMTITIDKAYPRGDLGGGG